MEGIEASGKSTLLAGLTRALCERGLDVVATREPGGTPFGDRVRSLFVQPDGTIEPLAEALLVNAARAQHVQQVVSPALAAGRFVLSDRFATATLAYQGFGRGLDFALLRRLEVIATGGVEPELVLLVDIPVALSRERAHARAAAARRAVDRLEREDDEFHERVRAGYLELAHQDARIAVLDGARSSEALLADAWRLLCERLRLG